jgi:hypothetical protein
MSKAVQQTLESNLTQILQKITSAKKSEKEETDQKFKTIQDQLDAMKKEKDEVEESMKQEKEAKEKAEEKMNQEKEAKEKLEKEKNELSD